MHPLRARLLRRLLVLGAAIVALWHVGSKLAQTDIEHSFRGFVFSSWGVRLLPWLAKQLIFIILAVHAISLVAIAWPGFSATEPWHMGLANMGLMFILGTPVHALLQVLASKMFQLYLPIVHRTWAFTAAVTIVNAIAHAYSTWWAERTLRWRTLRVILAVILWSVCAVWVLTNNEPYMHFYRPPPDVIPSNLCPPNLPSRPFQERFAEYVKFHHEMLTGSSEWKDKRLLVFQTAALRSGLGNYLQGLVSTFLLAMLTNRAFLVDWRTHTDLNAELHDLFETPGFEWSYHHALMLARTRHGNAYVDSLPQHSEWLLGYCRSCPFRSYPESGGAADRLICHPTIGLDPNVTIWSLGTTQWFGSILAHNPAFRMAVCDLTGPDIFGTIAKELLRPAPPVAQRIRIVEHKFVQNGGDIVSVQMRRLENNAASEDMEHVFMSCALALSPTFETRWFLATDSFEVRERWRAQLGDKVITLHDTIQERFATIGDGDPKFKQEFMTQMSQAPDSHSGVTNLAHTFDLGRGTVAGMQDALADMFLLGMGKQIIISPFSTFGYVAHARTSLMPHVVTRDNLCVKMLSSQPCSMYWFGVTLTPCFDPHKHLSVEMLNQHDCWL